MQLMNDFMRLNQEAKAYAGQGSSVDPAMLQTHNNALLEAYNKLNEYKTSKGYTGQSQSAPAEAVQYQTPQQFAKGGEVKKKITIESAPVYQNK
jgi:hypothetical protein